MGEKLLIRIDRAKLGKAMAKKGIGVMELMEKADVSTATFYRAISKGSFPRTVSKIADALGVGLEEIIKEEA